MNTKIIIAANKNAAVEHLTAQANKAAVGACIYAGDGIPHVVILEALNHHGPRADRPAACVQAAVHTKADDFHVIVLSHVDLDAVGGVMTLLGEAAETEESFRFWTAAATADTAGPHKIDPEHSALRKLQAYWAWAGRPENRAPLCKEGVVDVTELVLRHIATVKAILADREDLMVAGSLWAADQSLLETRSFAGHFDIAGLTIVVRISACFTNHLYRWHGGIADGVVALNTNTKAITLSWENGGKGRPSAAKVMQRAFGPEAGGRAGIAGTPRGKEYTSEDFDKVLDAIQALAS